MHNDAHEMRDLAGAVVSGYEAEIQRLKNRAENAEALAARGLHHYYWADERFRTIEEVLEQDVVQCVPQAPEYELALAAVRRHLDAKEGKE